MNTVEAKDPEEAKFYTFDWTLQLNAGATIASQLPWSATPIGLTFTNQSVLAGNLKTTAKIGAGVAGTDYLVLNTVTTSDGETLEETGVLRVRDSHLD